MPEPTFPNEGARWLSARLPYGETKKLAAKFKVDASFISKIAAAKRKPNSDLRAKFEDEPTTRIPWRLWDQPPTSDPVPSLPGEESGGAPAEAFPVADPPPAAASGGG